MRDYNRLRRINRKKQVIENKNDHGMIYIIAP
jgi:hypothetical protein